jgi:hypothetical protein
MKDEDERLETSGTETRMNDAKQLEDSLSHCQIKEAQGQVDAPMLLTSRSASALGYLTGDLIMSRLGVYDPMATKEVSRFYFCGVGAETDEAYVVVIADFA